MAKALALAALVLLALLVRRNRKLRARDEWRIPAAYPWQVTAKDPVTGIWSTYTGTARPRWDDYPEILPA